MPDLTISPTTDPVTAGLMAADSLFKFLATPAGQSFCNNVNTATVDFNNKVVAIVGHIESWFSALKTKAS